MMIIFFNHVHISFLIESGAIWSPTVFKISGYLSQYVLGFAAGNTLFPVPSPL